ncbi:hypothetical protein AB0H34_30225 [Saccharopolyspora shandongensis]|uniref:hypothetical protein n=1 Tax=Saccharopolyspora shandongensis TaxID=418495 RepID=UPI0033C95160
MALVRFLHPGHRSAGHFAFLAGDAEADRLLNTDDAASVLAQLLTTHPSHHGLKVDALSAVWEHHQRPDTELLIIPASRYDDQLAAELEAAGFTLLGTPEGRAPASETTPATPGRVWVSTSGSSGRPKRVAHTLRGLTTVSTPQAPRRWLLPFTPGTYAWWQLVTLSLNVPGQDLVTVEAGGLGVWPVLAAAEGVTAVSATHRRSGATRCCATAQRLRRCGWSRSRSAENLLTSDCSRTHDRFSRSLGELDLRLHRNRRSVCGT